MALQSGVGDLSMQMMRFSVIILRNFSPAPGKIGFSGGGAGLCQTSTTSAEKMPLFIDCRSSLSQGRLITRS